MKTPAATIASIGQALLVPSCERILTLKCYKDFSKLLTFCYILAVCLAIFGESLGNSGEQLPTKDRGDDSPGRSSDPI